MNQANSSTAPTTKSLDKQLLTYALAGGAILAGASPANAAVIYYSGPTLNTAGTFFDLDLNTDLFTDFTFNSASVASGTLGASFGANVSFPGTGGVTDPLVFGQTIGTASSFSASPYKISKAFVGTDGTVTPSSTVYPIGSDQYMGLQFDIGGSAHYGWALIQTSTSASFNDPDWTGVMDVQLKQFAYESVAGADITAGAMSDVPEPSSLALFALGAAGIAAIRRRRKTS